MRLYVITPQDIEESARVWESIDLENATRIPSKFQAEERTPAKKDDSIHDEWRERNLPPIEWRIDPEIPDVLKG